MVTSIDAYRKKQESDVLFSLREGGNPMLKFVEVGKANRINSAKQAKLLTAGRTFAACMGFDWLNDFCDFVEDYQVTCGLPHNSKEMLLEAIQFDRLAEHYRNKTSINVGSVGGDGKK